MFRPPFLQPGDKVALVSPAGIIETPCIENAVHLLKEWGLEPIVGKHAATRFGYFAGTDEERAEDMQWAMDNEDIRAIFCTRGGYGSLRIVEKLDYSKFQGNPKWLIGFSDITVFHSKLNTLGIESMHAPMPKTFGSTEIKALRRFKEFLFGNITSYCIPSHPLNREGIVQAEFIGGNLTLVHCLHSTTLECKHQNPILFLEDVGENLYSIDRMLQCMSLTDKLAKLQGLIIGDFSEMQGLNFGMDAYEIIQQTIQQFSYPVCYGFPAGHTENNYPLILGSTIELDVNSNETIITFKNK